MPPDPRVGIRERVLLAAIQDIQGSIRANDGKHSAALILHGLLFAGTTNVAVQLDESTYRGAHLAIGGIALAIAAFAFAVSLACLLRAVAPHRPSRDLIVRMVSGARPPGVFFPDLGRLDRLARSQGRDELTLYRCELEGLDEQSVTLELGFEVLKVQEILEHDRRWARRGFMALGVELIFVAIFLSSVAIAIL